MKSYTDLEQSKKLAGILPIESADMRYTPLGDMTHPWVWTDTFIEKDAVLCWSLAALLDVLPSNKNVITTVSRGGWQMEPIDYLPNVWWCEYEDNESCNILNANADNPVDACYEMILKLHEKNLL